MRRNVVTITALILGLCAPSAALARERVNVSGPHLAALLLHRPAHVDRTRSCQAGPRESQARAPGPSAIGERERRGATVACEQPPRSQQQPLGLGQIQSATALNPLTG